MPAPVRPIFRNGQRLTAERLTQTSEFLRSWIRRLSLGPLSAGVAAGLELEVADDPSIVIVNPGLAIDGKGRLLVLESEQRLSLTAIEATADVGPLNPGDVVRVDIVLDDSGGDASDPCNPQVPAESIERVRIMVARDAITDEVNNPNPLEHALSCVDPWGALDVPPGVGCGVTMGHIVLTADRKLTVTHRFRQGVSPRFSVLHDSSGEAAIAMGEMTMNVGGANQVTHGIAVMEPAIFQRPVRIIQSLIGTSVQATHVAPVDQAFVTAAIMPGTNRVLALTGAAEGELKAGGLCAVTCAFDPTPGAVTIAGLPLYLLETQTAGSGVTVQRGEDSKLTLIGLSAGKSFAGSSGPQVGIAVAGILKVRVKHTGDVVVGTELTPEDASGSTTDKLVPATLPTQYVVARAAQKVTGNSDSSEMLAFVVHPPVKRG